MTATNREGLLIFRRLEPAATPITIDLLGVSALNGLIRFRFSLPSTHSSRPFAMLEFGIPNVLGVISNADDLWTSTRSFSPSLAASLVNMIA